MTAQKRPAFDFQVIRIGIHHLIFAPMPFGLRQSWKWHWISNCWANSSKQLRNLSLFEIRVAPAALLDRKVAVGCSAIVSGHSLSGRVSKRWCYCLIASKPGRCCIAQCRAEMGGQIYSRCCELMNTWNLTYAWSSLKSETTSIWEIEAPSEGRKQSFHQYARNASDWSSMEKYFSACQKQKSNTVTIKQETCAWIQMVVDAAVKLVAFNDVTVVLLSQAWRQVSREFFAECRAKFWSVRSRSLGSGKVVKKSRNISWYFKSHCVHLAWQMKHVAFHVSDRQTSNWVSKQYYAETCHIRSLPDWGLMCTPAVASVHVLQIQAQWN